MLGDALYSIGEIVATVGEVGQCDAQPLPAAGYPRHDGSYWNVHYRGGFRVGVSLDVGVIHHCPKALGQAIHRGFDVVVGQRIQDLGFSGAQSRGQSRGAAGQFVLGDLVDRNLRWASLFGAIRAHPPVVEDPEEPRLEVAALGECVESRVCVQQCVLQQVFGVSVAARQPPCATR